MRSDLLNVLCLKDIEVLHTWHVCEGDGIRDLFGLLTLALGFLLLGRADHRTIPICTLPPWDLLRKYSVVHWLAVVHFLWTIPKQTDQYSQVRKWTKIFILIRIEFHNSIAIIIRPDEESVVKWQFNSIQFNKRYFHLIHIADIGTSIEIKTLQ